MRFDWPKRIAESLDGAGKIASARHFQHGTVIFTMGAFIRFFAVARCALVVGALHASAHLSAADFLAGADISALPVHEANGATYRSDGVTGNAIDILRGSGVNWFRLRLFVNPNSSDPFVVNDLDYTIELAQRVKASGGKLLLDFHYSDTWADPGRQTKPAAWTSLSFDSLVERVRDYTFDAIDALKSEGVLPDMVQIGNEISNGILWNSGYVWTGGAHDTGFNNLASLLNAGISGAKQAAGPGNEPLIMIHHDKGAQWSTTSFYFDKLVARNVDFDVIGYSYYPKWHYNPTSGAGDIQDLQTNLNNSATRYGKPVVVVETGFASRGAQFEPDYEFDVSASGQQQFLNAVVSAVENVPNGLGAGVFWWYPEARPTAGLSVWEGGRYGLFDQNGNLLPAVSVFEQFIDPPTLGDYNGDGAVDASDYVVWRERDGTPTGYDQWRTNFGATSAGAESRTRPVPEPNTLLASLIAILLLVTLVRVLRDY
jgi:arabinogalactan endo-1,4-beta-galactosidase